MIDEKLISNEQFMFELSNWIEIHKTHFFSTLFEGYDEEEFDDMIRYLTYLHTSKNIKKTYSKTWFHIPEIIQSIQRVKDNVLIVNNTVNEIIKRGEYE